MPDENDSSVHPHEWDAPAVGLWLKSNGMEYLVSQAKGVTGLILSEIVFNGTNESMLAIGFTDHLEQSKLKATFKALPAMQGALNCRIAQLEAQLLENGISPHAHNIKTEKNGEGNDTPTEPGIAETERKRLLEESRARLKALEQIMARVLEDEDYAAADAAKTETSDLKLRITRLEQDVLTAVENASLIPALEAEIETLTQDKDFLKSLWLGEERRIMMRSVKEADRHAMSSKKYRENVEAAVLMEDYSTADEMKQLEIESESQLLYGSFSSRNEATEDAEHVKEVEAVLFPVHRALGQLDACARCLSLAGLESFRVRAIDLKSGHASNLDQRAEESRSLAFTLKRSGEEGVARSLLESASSLFSEASNAKVLCEFKIASLTDSYRELLDSLWASGKRGEVQAMAAVGLSQRFARILQQALGRLDAFLDASISGNPGNSESGGGVELLGYPSPFLSACRAASQ